MILRLSHAVIRFSERCNKILRAPQPTNPAVAAQEFEPKLPAWAREGRSIGDNHEGTSASSWDGIPAVDGMVSCLLGIGPCAWDNSIACPQVHPLFH
jgi:hypothetical protein